MSYTEMQYFLCSVSEAQLILQHLENSLHESQDLFHPLTTESTDDTHDPSNASPDSFTTLTVTTEQDTISMTLMITYSLSADSNSSFSTLHSSNPSSRSSTNNPYAQHSYSRPASDAANPLACLVELLHDYDQFQPQNLLVAYIHDPGTGASKKKSLWEPSNDD
jgi:hypothetical protein